MIYCFNPQCANPRNPDQTKVCYSCGQRLYLGDRYRGIKLIGQGGFGRTFLAEDDRQESKQRCVVKQFYPEGQPNATIASQLFEKEALRLKQLGEHPQIPQFYDTLEQEGHQYIIQEFIDGQNLAQELAENGVFNESKIFNLLKDLLPVLRFIHQGEIIHRDIKPANMIRCPHRGKLVIVDFGAAKYATATALQKTGTIIGSAEYIAPEQLRGKALFASDIYSLGVTCIYLLTNVSPFDLFDISENTWVWRDYLVDNPVSDNLGNILDKMVQNSLKERYHSVEEVMADLHLPLSLGKFYPPDLSPSIEDENDDWECFQTLSGHSDGVNAIAFSADGETLVSGSTDWTIKLWSLKTNQEINTLIGHSDKVNCVIFHPQGGRLASGSWDGTVKIWNSYIGELIGTFSGHKNWVSSVIFSPDGQMVISGGYDRSIKFWNLRKREEVETINLLGYQNWVTCLRLSPQKTFFASGNCDHTIRLWDLGSHEQITQLIGHTNWVNGIDFSPDGQVIASGSTDKTLKLWRLKTQEKIGSFSGHSAAINSVVFHPTLPIIASGSSDNTIRFWCFNPESWQLKSQDSVITLKAHSAPVRAVVFSPNGQILASGSDDGEIRLWQSQARKTTEKEKI